mgnify:CR=1 FL=1
MQYLDPDNLDDAFFPAVFSYRQRDMEDGEMDFRLYDLGEHTVLAGQVLALRLNVDFSAAGVTTDQNSACPSAVTAGNVSIR